MAVLLPILAALGIGSTLFGFARDRKAAKAAKKAAAFEAGILEEQSEDVLIAGQKAGYRVAAGARGLRGAQTASLAEQGLDVASGSAADVISTDERLAELDILEIENNAAREALGLKKQAELVRMGGKNTAASYNNQSAGTLLGGAAQLFGIYSAYGQNKAAPRKSGSGSTYGGYGSPGMR